MLLALPAVLLPRAWPGFGFGGPHYDLGWPLSDVHGHIGYDGHWRLFLTPEPSFLLFGPLWCYAASIAWRIRTWARATHQWTGSIVQATLTSLYCLLLFYFFYGWVDLLWMRKVWPADEAELERVYSFAWGWLPWLYLVGAVGIFMILLCDAWNRRGFRWLAHFAFALCFAFAFRHQAPLFALQLGDFEYFIRLGQRRMEPLAESPHINARLLDSLEQSFASKPEFNDAFWRDSRRVAGWRGLNIINEVMQRSRSWSHDEGLAFVPLLASLPQEATFQKLKRYHEKSTAASEQYWAGRYLAELESPSVKETAPKDFGNTL